jgi:hypothetical protein
MVVNLFHNEIWDEGADAIINNLELKDWVSILWVGNTISKEEWEKLKTWWKSYLNKWITCSVFY